MNKILSLVAIMALSTMAVNAASIGTQAGTVVTNNASLTYSVGGTEIVLPITADDTFVVDDKVDLTVAHKDLTIVTVTPGATKQVTEFSVTNEGNKVHDFILTSTQNNGNPFSEADTIDVTDVAVFVESGATPGYQVAEDVAVYIDELGSGDEQIVYIVATVPNAAALDDVAEVTLTAQVAVGGTGGTQGTVISTDDSAVADTAGTVSGDEQIVFADAAGSNDAVTDGKHGDTSAYKIKTAVLTVVKTSCVLSDPINTTTNPKRIPGAIIRYAFEIENAGNSDATGVVVTDDMVSLNAYTDAATNFFIESGTCDCGAGGTTAAGGISGYTSPNSKLDFETIAESTTECGYFEVEIK